MDTYTLTIEDYTVEVVLQNGCVSQCIVDGPNITKLSEAEQDNLTQLAIQAREDGSYGSPKLQEGWSNQTDSIN